MRHFAYLSAAQINALFERPPERFDRGSGTDLLSVALGATLYMPADRPSLVADITKQAAAGVTSVVVCLEDAIADEQVADAEGNLVEAFSALHAEPHDELPLLFVRVREAAQIPALVRRLGRAAHLLDGFVLPKFTALSGTEYLLTLEAAEREAGVSLLAMPVIESGAVLYAETRVDELTRLRALLHRDRRRILAVRIGATDLCALYGLRRSPELSIYDIKVVSGAHRRRRQRARPHRRHRVHGVRAGVGVLRRPRADLQAAAAAVAVPPARRRALRGELVSRAIDGLIREVQLDQANGLIGKTAIHPGHVAVVNALSVVSAEEYRDARDLVAGRARGRGDALRAPQQDERDPPAPVLGAAHDAALAGVRGRGRGCVASSTCSCADESSQPCFRARPSSGSGCSCARPRAGPDPRVLLGLALRGQPAAGAAPGLAGARQARAHRPAGGARGRAAPRRAGRRRPRRTAAQPLPVDLLHAAVRDAPGAAAALHAAARTAIAAEPVDAVVLGFAETATALGHCVAEALGGADYLHSTRRPVAGVATGGRVRRGALPPHRAPAAAVRPGRCWPGRARSCWSTTSCPPAAPP